MMSAPSVIHDLIAGAVGGCAGIIVGHPFDTLKVQLQTQLKGHQYPNLLSCFKTVSSQGLSRGIFRGLSWPLLSYGAINSVYFGAYGKALQWLTDGDLGKQSYLSIYLAGSAAGVAQVVIACPIDVIKVTLQSQIPRKPGCKLTRYYNGPVAAFADLIKEHGLRSIYRGLFTQLLRDLPSSGSYLTIYEFLRHQASIHSPVVPSQMVNFVSGGIAGVFSWMIIIPLDVVKSRLQSDTERRHFRGFVDCVRKSYREEGVSVFFRGASMVSLRAFPVNAVTLMTYSECLRLLNSNRETV